MQKQDCLSLHSGGHQVSNRVSCDESLEVEAQLPDSPPNLLKTSKFNPSPFGHHSKSNDYNPHLYPTPSLYASPITTLIVGGPDSSSKEPKPAKFTVHTPLLTNSSRFFATCLYPSSRSNTSTPQDSYTTKSNPWSESQTNTITLPTERIEDIAFLLQWLYSGGSRRNRLTEDLFREKSGLESWRNVQLVQPGLEHTAVDEAVQGYLAWKVERKEKMKMKMSVSVMKPGDDQTRNESVDVPVDGNNAGIVQGNDGGVIGQSNAAVEPYELQTAKHKNTHSVPSPTCISQPPNLPALGPLIRLYILADKYGIDEPLTPSTNTNTNTDTTSLGKLSHYSSKINPPKTAEPSSIAPNPHLHTLRSQITLRILAIHCLANIIPDREDIARLWDAIPNDVLGKHGLKRALVVIFTQLRPREMLRVFGVDEENGGVVSEDVFAAASAAEWHPKFLMDLVVEKRMQEEFWRCQVEESRKELASLREELGRLRDEMDFRPRRPRRIIA